jgi:hypothetical protein
MSERADYLALTIGHAGRLGAKDLRKAIKNGLLIIHRISPLTAIDIGIGGYDDDPREIWEIPEARRFVIGFANGLLTAGIPLDRLLPVSVHMIKVCLAAEHGQTITPTDEPEIDIGDQLREHQERARRQMN